MNKLHDLSFKPGWGQVPPELAGRENERATITEALERLKARSIPAQNIALIGPRGNGKTTLLRWTEIHAERYSDKVKCIDLNTDCFRSHDDLVNALAHRGGISAIRELGISISLNLLILKIGFNRGPTAHKLLRAVLGQRCSRNGLAVMIDEAHKLNRYPDVARAFFNDVQVLAGSGRPLLLILAGTPDITPRLNMIEATFWNRLKKIGIGLLDAVAARDALRIPLEGMGYRVGDRALEQAVNEAQCYPYFLQIVGDALHKAAKADPAKLESGNEIGDSILEQALEEFNITRNNHYYDQYIKLREAGILGAAETVARLFTSQKKNLIPTSAIEVAVAQSITPRMEEIAKSDGGAEPAAWVEAKLREFGFLWSRIGDERVCMPGIPSFMHYIVEAACEREREERRFLETIRPNPASERTGPYNEVPD